MKKVKSMMSSLTQLEKDMAKLLGRLCWDRGVVIHATCCDDSRDAFTKLLKLHPQLLDVEYDGSVAEVIRKEREGIDCETFTGEVLIMPLAKMKKLHAERLELLRQVAYMQWQPIETAPRDEYVLLHVPGEGPIVGRYVPDRNLWLSDLVEQLGIGGEPTHWMPLPESPESEDDDEC